MPSPSSKGLEKSPHFTPSQSDRCKELRVSPPPPIEPWVSRALDTNVEGDDLCLMTVSTTAAASHPPTLPSNHLAKRSTIPSARLNTRVVQCDI